MSEVLTKTQVDSETQRLADYRKIPPSIDSRVPLDQAQQAQIGSAMLDPLYGPYLRRVAELGSLALDRYEAAGSTLGATLTVLARLYLQASADYRQTRSPLDPAVIQALQTDGMNGRNSESVPPELWTSPMEGVRQVMVADRLLGAVSDEVRSLLSTLVFNAFYAKNERTVEEEPMAHIDGITEAEADVVFAAARYCQEQGLRLDVIDVGCGTGLLVSAVMKRLAAAGIDHGELSYRAVDVVPSILDRAARTATQNPDVSAVGMEVRLLDRHTALQGNAVGQLQFIHGDAVQLLPSLSQVGPRDSDRTVTLLASAYALNFLPSSAKRRLVAGLAQRQNVITALGDTASNTSLLNRSDVNLKANGPMNCGNLGLERILRQHNLAPVDLRVTAPADLHNRTRRQVLSLAEDDVLFYLSARGSRALAALDLRPTQELRSSVATMTPSQPRCEVQWM